MLALVFSLVHLMMLLSSLQSCRPHDAALQSAQSTRHELVAIFEDLARLAHEVPVGDLFEPVAHLVHLQIAFLAQRVSGLSLLHSRLSNCHLRSPLLGKWHSLPLAHRGTEG